MSVLIPLYGRHGDVRGFAKVDESDAEWLRAEAAARRIKAPQGGDEPAPWRLAAAGYAKCASGQRGRSLYMHRLILGLADDDARFGDHINGDRLDNRRSNLRILTASTNCQNRVVAPGASPHRGVSRCTATGRWRAGCNVAGVWTRTKRRARRRRRGPCISRSRWIGVNSLAFRRSGQGPCVRSCWLATTSTPDRFA